MGVLLLSSCDSGSGKATDIVAVSIINDVITVSDGSPIMEKIKSEKVNKTPYRASFSTSGVVQAIPTSYAEIATPFAGRVVQSFVRLGQSVERGTPLFEISSPTFFETGKAYFSSKQEMEQALNSLNREKDLFANRVGVAKDVEEAQVNYELKRQEYENALSALKVFQVDPGQMKLGEPLIVRSPISGRVISNKIVIGQYIKEDTDPLVVVADLNKVWVIAHVKEKDIMLIDDSQEVNITLSASPDCDIKGKIYHISEMLDQSTRSVEVIIECDNRDRQMKPFMYGTVRLTDRMTDAIVVPTSAILQQEDSCYVLVAEGGRKFRKTAVSVASSTGDQSVITDGLNEGDEIVTEGAFYLLDAK